MPPRQSRVLTSTSLREHLAVRGDEQDVVEGQALAELVVEHGGLGWRAGARRM